jgi:uncharacterized protein (TIGR00251 family)
VNPLQTETKEKTRVHKKEQKSMNNCFRIDGGKIRLDIKAIPGASKTEFAGVKDGRLRIRLAAAPEDGKANAELLNFLSKTLDCPKRDLQILSGEKARLKTIALPLECGARLEGGVTFTI